jgi:hypothetical protein
VFRARLPKVAYRDPWNLTLEQRRARLPDGRVRVAWYYAQPDTSTFRYRVYNMVQALATGPDPVAATWFAATETAALRAAFDSLEVLVLGRTRYNDSVGSLITEAKAHGVRVLFDTDDFVFDDRFVHLFLETLAQPPTEDNWDRWFAYIGRMGAALRLCDGAIVTNEFLAARVRAFCDIPCAVVPNFLNHEQIALNARIMTAKRATSYATDGTPTIGYFSGSPSHNRDFAVVAPALARLLARDPRLRLRVVGFLDSHPAMAPFRDRVEIVPLQDFLNLQRLVGEVEVNIAPLQDNVFTNCKSELKFFEAAAVGTLTAATPTFTFAQAIRDGENGFLAPAPRWEEAIDQVLALGPSYAAMAERAAEEVNARYAPETHAATVRAALGIG